MVSLWIGGGYDRLRLCRLYIRSYSCNAQRGESLESFFMELVGGDGE